MTDQDHLQHDICTFYWQGFSKPWIAEELKISVAEVERLLIEALNRMGTEQ